ncbi:hypothetical protein MTR67_027910 [Solanum verrucosum]|uniref:Uncharacterized protein n=1 Tax=Solanum verrucosum TaxID=315347 RepID=A0AAF0TZS0_SOLVR|nr:hypothetical protein MTR67_027910 [Solanum verrucosum]
MKHNISSNMYKVLQASGRGCQLFHRDDSAICN